MVSLKHVSVPSTKKLTRAEWDEQHILTGVPGTYLGFGNDGRAVELSPPASEVQDPGDLTLIFDNKLI